MSYRILIALWAKIIFPPKEPSIRARYIATKHLRYTHIFKVHILLGNLKKQNNIKTRQPVCSYFIFLF